MTEFELREFQVHPPSFLAGLGPSDECYYLKMRFIFSSQREPEANQFIMEPAVSRNFSFTIRQHPTHLAVSDASQGTDTLTKPCYYLRWGFNRVYGMALENRAEFFFTGKLTGCTFIALRNTRGEIYVYHHNSIGEVITPASNFVNTLETTFPGAEIVTYGEENYGEYAYVFGVVDPLTKQWELFCHCKNKSSGKPETYPILYSRHFHAPSVGKSWPI